MFPKRVLDPLAVAYELGDVAVNRAVDKLEQVCEFEKRRRQEVNAAEIKSLSAELALRTEERDELRAEIRCTPRPEPGPRRSRIWYVSVALVLGFAGFAFAHLSLAPFGLGLETWLYAVALAGVCAYATDETLEKFGCRTLVMTVAITSFVTSIVGLVILALVRGDIVILYLKQSMSDGTSLVASAGGLDAVHFYEKTAPKLALFFALLAVAMELATGLALYEARKIGGVMPDVLKALNERLRAVETEMIALLHRIEFLKREPDIFENEFARDFYLGLIQGAVRRGSKQLAAFFGVVVCLALLSPTIRAQRLDVVTGLDLSLTSAAENYDGSLEHAKNVDGTARLIERLPGGTRIRVLGITDESFARPLVLLSGDLPVEPGPLTLIDHIAIARSRFAGAVRDLGRTAPPKYPQTDVIGFLMVASDLFHEDSQARRILAIFSDMRHSAPPPDIESPRVVPVASALRTIEARHQIADLRGVEIYVYGVHAAQKDIAYWQSLQSFWQQYFARSGANLRVFSMMRDIQAVTDDAPPAVRR